MSCWAHYYLSSEFKIHSSSSINYCQVFALTHDYSYRKQLLCVNNSVTDTTQPTMIRVDLIDAN